MERQEQQYNVLISICSTVGHRGEETLAPEHVLAYRITGTSRTFIGDDVYESKPGSIALVRRNTLLKMVKYPEADGRPFQSIAVYFDQATLKRIATAEDISMDRPYTGDPAVDLSSNIFLKGYFESLLPFFKSGVSLTARLAELKTREAIMLLLEHNIRIKDMLFDFSEPFKMELGDFMNRNYTFHIPLADFARLSGRSLTTFKRDFRKLFGDSPERWIRQKRLERARFLIAHQHQPPASVYLDVGFDSLSHFSTAFKKHFGYNPTDLVAKRKK